MGGGDTKVIDHGTAQSGEQHYGAVAGGDIHQGADANRVLAMVELLVKNSWDDQQRRAIWEAKEAEERRQRQNEADLHREMTRARLERIAGNVERLTEDMAETQRLGRAARRWLIGLTLALVVIGAIVVAVVADRLGVMAVALLVATIAARMGK
jgi:hypothetical protein